MRNFILTTEIDEISMLMSPETREEVHSKCTPCSARQYILEYLSRNNDIKYVLEHHYNIDVLELKELEDIDIRNLLLLENKILTQEETHYLMLNQNVAYMIDLGYPPYRKQYHLAELALFDGSIVYVYYEYKEDPK